MCYNTITNLWRYCSTIVKIKYSFLFSLSFSLTHLSPSLFTHPLSSLFSLRLPFLYLLAWGLAIMGDKFLDRRGCRQDRWWFCCGSCSGFLRNGCWRGFLLVVFSMGFSWWFLQWLLFCGFVFFFMRNFCGCCW